MKFAATIALIVFSIAYSYISTQAAEPPQIWLIAGCDDNRGRIRAVNTGDDMPVATEWTMLQEGITSEGSLQLASGEAHDWWVFTESTLSFEGGTISVAQCGYVIFLPSAQRPD